VDDVTADAGGMGGPADSDGAEVAQAAEVARFRERYAAVLAETGWPRMPARVFAALSVVDSGRLTAAEIADVLRASPAAVSGAVRYLITLGLIGREREPGSRRDHFRTSASAWTEVLASRDRTLGRIEAAMREGVRAVGPDTPAGRRFTDMIEFFTFLRAEVSGLDERWRLYQAAKAAGGAVLADVSDSAADRPT
jgi:hypothetical protein